MKKGAFGDIQVNLLLGDVNAGYPRLIVDEAAWDDLRLHSPEPTILVRDVFDSLQPATQRVILDVLKSVSEIDRQYGDPLGLDREKDD